MSSPANQNHQQYGDLERENQRLRQQVEVLQRRLREQTKASPGNQSILSEDLLRLVIDTIPDSVFWKDRNSVLLGCDQSFAQLAGLDSPEDIVGKTDYDMPWQPEETEFFLECDRRVMESGIPELGIIEPQLQNDGSQHWLETNKVPIKDNDGNVIGILGTFVDVTQRQQTQLELQQQNDILADEFKARTQKLKATELRLERLADNIPGVIFQYCLKPDGTQSFPYVSDKSREIYGIESSDFIRVFDLTHTDDVDHVQASIQVSAQTLQQFECEYRIITPSGILKWVQVLSKPELQDNGTIVWDGIITDISDRKNAEQALRESEVKYKQILDAITDMVLVKREHSRIVWANQAFREHYGMSNQELQTLIDAPFTPPDYTQQYIRDDVHVFTTGETLDIEEEIANHNGDVRQFSTIKSAIRNEEGEIFLTVGVSRDISDRKSAEAKLRQKEEQYRQVFETIIDGLGIVDLDQGKLVDVNPAYHQMHGYSYSEFLALPYSDIVHSDSHALLEQFIADLKEGRIFACQAQNLHSSGHIIDIEVKGIPFPYRGKSHALALVRDISETVRLERERDRQAQALRSIVEGTAAHTGEDFFRACVKSLATILGVAYVFIAEIDSSQSETVQANVIASWINTDFGGQFQYNLHGTLGKNIVEKCSTCHFSDSAQTLFSDDPYLTSLGAESYVGIPLLDSCGTTVGLISVLHTEYMAEPSEQQISILEIFAARVGAEIERMRVDRALREKERTLQLTLQAGKMGCWRWNCITNHVDWSDSAEEVLGLASNYFGNTFEVYSDLIHPQDRDRVQQLIGHALSHGQEYHAEYRLLLPDGSIQWIRARGEVWRDSQGDVIGLLGSILNDTPHKLAAIALLDSTEQLQQQARQEQLLNQIANQIRTSLDLDRILETTVREIKQFLGVDRCHFAWYVQEEEEAYWDVTAEERNPDFPSFMGKHPTSDFKFLSELVTCQEVIKLDDVTTLDDADLQQTLNAFGNQSMLVLSVHTDSESFGIIACIHHQSVRPWRDEEVDFLKVIVAQVAIAIKQSKLLAQSQARTQELEELLRTLQHTQTQLVQSEKMSSLGQMVAGIAHEINNPMSFIHGNLVYAHEYTKSLIDLCSLYKEYYPNPHPEISEEIEAIDLDFLKEDLQKLFRSMNVGTNRIRDIVRSLRTFSRLDEAALKDVDLHEGIDSTLMLLQTRLRAQNWRSKIEVVREYGDLPRVECYAGQLNQVFMNLLSNAIDALESRYRTAPQDEKHHSRIHIKTERDGNSILICISDNGEGMDEDTQANIFNPFFTTKPVGEGTGLGLAIAHQVITEKHKGSITCRSHPSEGTMFTINLPVLQ